MMTMKDKTDKLFKSMITPKLAALCIRVLLTYFVHFTLL